MCIVSFVLEKEKFILTFNRDERPLRPTEKPAWREINGLSVFCPIDREAGGTWIGYNSLIAACLQNGAFVKHRRNPPYRKSRGIILREILGQPQYEKLLTVENFDNIEPFTLSIFSIENKLLSIYRFDGNTLSKETSDLSKPVLLTSCTLYDRVAHKAIERDFKDRETDPEKLFSFHDEHMIGKSKNKFTDMVPTISITQLVIENGHPRCHYFDSLTNMHFKT